MRAQWLQSAWSVWQRRHTDGRIPHAILIAGPQGLGKRELAADLAGSLLCTTPQDDARPCGHCRACLLLAAGTHPDFYPVSFELNDEGKLRTEIIVDQMRRLSESLSKTSQFGGWRVAVIDPADGMNASSFNALLKTLEEPDAKAVLVLVSDRPSRLPATIHSRCQRIDLRFPPRAQALEWLANSGLRGSAAELVLDLAAGNPGLALRYGNAENRVRLESTLADLAAVAAGRASAHETAGQWIKDEPAERLLLSAQAIRVIAWAARGQGSAPKSAAALASLTAAAQFPKLAAWWDRANVVREQLKTPLRADLLLLELLREFRVAMQPPRDAKG